MCTTKVSWKILAPTSPSTVLHRDHLSQVLGAVLGANNSHTSPPYPLVLLCTPAGYGKTTLLAETVKRFSLTCCWYFLEYSDMECRTFLSMLIASIRQHFPCFGSDLDELLTEGMAQDEAAVQKVLDALILALETDIPELCVLALCNYQAVNTGAQINGLVSQLLKRLPAQFRLVIESRARPDLDLSSLIAKHRVFEFGSNVLQFTAQDLCALAQGQNLPDFSEGEAVQLVNTFHGWITGILLGSRLGSAPFELSSSAQSGNWPTPGVYANRQQLLLFLTREVFYNETEICTFLKYTSLLEQMSPAFCDALLETSNAATLLARAEHLGLFVIRLSATEEPVYVCHPAVRELFSETLRHHESEKYRELHRGIASLSYEKHEYQAALQHAFDGQDYHLAARVITEAAQTLFEQGRSETVLRYLDGFPPSFAEKLPQLLLLRINIYLRRGDFANARECLDRAEARAQLALPAVPVEEKETAALRAGFAIAYGKLLLHQGEHALSKTQFEQALALLPSTKRMLHIYAHQQLGICLILSGQPIHEGIAQFRQALQLCQPRVDIRLTGELHHQLANAYEWSGHYTVAEHHRRRISALQDRPGQSQSIINNLTGMGLLKMRQGCVEEAEMSFQSILRLTHQSSRLLSSEAYALLGFGELELTRQHFQQALTYLERALDLAHQLEDRYLLNGVLNKLSLVYVCMGDIHTAQCLLDEVSLHSEETSSYEGMCYTLMKGTILLAQQRYDEAQPILEEVVHRTDTASILWLHEQAWMRLAACYLAQGEQALAKKVLQHELSHHFKENLDYSVQVELQIYPLLQPLVQEITTPDEQLEHKALAGERLSIYALGEPSVLLDTTPVTHWRMARAMELCFFLLEHKQPLRKDQIIAALWPEADDIERINRTFRSTIYYLRQVIGDACLVQRSGQYRLDLQAMYGQVWYDVTDFEAQRRIAKAALVEGDDESAAQAFQKMVNLYRGDYLQAFYSNWCIRRRDELRTAFMEAHQQLGFIAWRAEDWEKSLLHWQHLLTLDPCLEEAHYGIMYCYLQQGKRDLALRQYQRCKRELDEQLKIKPGPIIQKLYQHLLNAMV